jgi:putative ABC transport system permease protein
MGTIGLLLLIACANVANLMLVRGQSRRQELVVRSALGAGRLAIARVVLAESALLGFAGAIAGVAVAYVSLPLLLWLGANELPDVMRVRVDLASVLAAGAIAVVATMVCAATPLMQLALHSPRRSAALHGGRTIGEERAVSRTRQLLLIGQVAMALVLLVGAGLMIRTFDRLNRVAPGFRNADDVQTFRLTIPRLDPLEGDAGAANRVRLQQTQRAILERLAAVGGVTSVGFASGNDGLPLDGDGREIGLVPFIDGREAPDGVPRTWEIQNISPGFLETMQTAIVAGRGFTWDDVVNERPVMLVSDGLARREFGSREAALGRRISAFADAGTEVVGVVEDVHHNGLHQPAPPTVIYPPRPRSTASYVVRSTRAGDAALLRDLQNAIWAVHGELSTAGVQTLGELHRQAMARATMSLMLLGITGTLALMLALVGIYGVVSYAVGQRRREIGLRLALGARSGQVLTLFVRHALVLVAIGVVIGLCSAVGVTRMIASQLYGVSPLDVLTHVTIAVGLIAAGGLASYVSARRGAGVDPAQVLKGE